MNWVFDANAILSWLGGETNLELSKSKVFYSIVTEIELLSFHGITDEEERAIQNCLADMRCIQFTSDVTQHTIRLRRTFRLKIPDAIIAATAIALNAELITNDKTLLRLPGLRGRAASETPR